MTGNRGISTIDVLAEPIVMICRLGQIEEQFDCGQTSPQMAGSGQAATFLNVRGRPRPKSDDFTDWIKKMLDIGR
jgi:hypothetical protein